MGLRSAREIHKKSPSGPKAQGLKTKVRTARPDRTGHSMKSRVTILDTPSGHKVQDFLPLVAGLSVVRPHSTGLCLQCHVLKPTPRILENGGLRPPFKIRVEAASPPSKAGCPLSSIVLEGRI